MLLSGEIQSGIGRGQTGTCRVALFFRCYHSYCAQLSLCPLMLTACLCFQLQPQPRPLLCTCSSNCFCSSNPPLCIALSASPTRHLLIAKPMIGLRCGEAGKRHPAVRVSLVVVLFHPALTFPRMERSPHLHHRAPVNRFTKRTCRDSRPLRFFSCQTHTPARIRA